MARSETVLAMAHKNGGLSTHPIGRIIGKPIMGSCSFQSWDKCPKDGDRVQLEPDPHEGIRDVYLRQVDGAMSGVRSVQLLEEALKGTPKLH